VEELVEGDLVDLAEVLRSELFDEGVRVVAHLEEEADDCEGLLVLFVVLRAADELVDDVDLEVVLHVVQAVLGGAVHVHVVHLVLVGALAVKVGHLNAAEIASLEL
jgi:hypothetical protein